MVHRHALAEQVHWKDAAGPLGDGRVELRHVHQVGIAFDIDKPGRPACRDDGRHGWDGRIGSGDHLVARLHVECPQRQHQRVGAAADADPVAGAAVLRQLALEVPDALAQDQASRARNLIHRGQDVFPFRLVLGPVVPHLNRHGSSRMLKSVQWTISGLLTNRAGIAVLIPHAVATAGLTFRF